MVRAARWLALAALLPHAGALARAGPLLRRPPARAPCVRAAAPPRPVSRLNDSTKWLVVAAQTAAVWTRRDFVSPFIVIGSIAVAFSTAALKKAINQARPAGSPFADPGMPSSHALVSMFAATAWAVHLRSPPATAWLVSAAALVAALRVVCGYHTWAQVGVGATLGACSARSWMQLPAWAHVDPASAGALRAVFACYLSGSALFIAKKMATWRWSDEDMTAG